MKLPQINYGAPVQSLAQHSIAGAVGVETAKGNLVKQVGETGAQVIDHVQLLREQDKAIELRGEATDDMRTLEQAVDPRTGMVDVNMLNDEDRSAYMTSSDYDQNKDVVVGNKRLVPFHKVGGDVVNRFSERESKRAAVPTTRRGGQLYQQRDRGTTQAFADKMLGVAETSAIRTTVANSRKEVAKAAEINDVDTILDITDLMKGSGYMSEAQAMQLEGRALKQVQGNLVNDLTDISKNGANATFEGNHQLVDGADRQFKSIMAMANEHGEKIFSEKQKVTLEHQYDLAKVTQRELSTIEATYYGTYAEGGDGDAAARKAIVNFEKTPYFKQLDQFEQDKLVDQVKTRYHRISGMDKAGRAAGTKQTNMDIKNYEKARSEGLPVNNEQASALYIKTANEPELQKRLHVADRTAIFAASSYKDRAEQLDTYRSGDLSTVPEASEMQRSQIAIEGALDKDPLGYAQETGVAERVPFDPSQPELSIQAKRDANSMASEFYNRDMPLFNKKETKDLVNNIPEMSVDAQASLIQGIASSNDPTALATFDQISKDGGSLYGVAGGMVMEGGDPTNMLAGQKRILENPKIVPAKNDGGISVEGYLAEVGVDKIYAANPKHQQAMFESIKAEYAGLTKGTMSETFDSKMMDEAINNVSGGHFVFEASDGAESQIEAPFRGATEDDFTDGINRLNVSHIRYMGGVDGLTDEQAVKAIQEHGQFVSVGQGQYMVEINGALVMGESLDSQEFVFNFDTLREGANPLSPPPDEVEVNADIDELLQGNAL